MNSLFYFDTPSYGWVCLLLVRSSVPYVFSLFVRADTGVCPYGWVCLLHTCSSVLYVFSLSVTYVQKKTSLQSDVFFGCEVCSQKKTLLCSDVFFGCEVCSQKKDIALQRCLLWVPGRTRTVDIQNHNLTL